MSTPFRAITTGDKSIAERVSAPISAVANEFSKRQTTANQSYDAMNIDFVGLPDNQIAMAQQWGDAVRENLVEGYRTNNQDLIREAKNQGRALQSYIKATQQDYTIGINSLNRAKEKNFQDLSNSREEIEMGFKNRYQENFGFEVDERGYPKGIVIGGQKVGVNDFVTNMKENPFMVVDAVDFGKNYIADSVANRHTNDIIAEASPTNARAKAAEYARKDIDNGMVSNEDLAVLYAMKNKLISDVNNPTAEDVKRIQGIAQDGDKLAEAQDLYIQDYQNYLEDQWNVNKKSRDRAERIQQDKVASQGILALDPVAANVNGEMLGVYYTDVEGVSFDIKGNERVSAVGVDANGDIKYAQVVVKKVDPLNPSAATYETKQYVVSKPNEVLPAGAEALTPEVQQLIKNRIEIKAPKQIRGWERFTSKVEDVIKNAPVEPNVEEVMNIFSNPNQ